ncbi:extracellular solute-binding protein [Actinomadura sp. KC06]|uniref:ABC transporter substrate-binding protein n=1 Tax=Actinomadura sp. KC06 TaxID=2530369 RepID=UPI001A9D452A|nr:extracellular solute-binding protein [Actinomadura sp. KC06]
MRRALGLRSLIGMLVVLAAMTGCGGGGGQSDQVRLTFWTWVPGIEKSIDLWNSQNPDVQVELESITAGVDGGYAKMFSAVKAGAAPDLAQVEYWEIPAFLLEQGLVELGRYGAKQHAGEFVPWQWRQGVFNDGVYAIPQASGPMALYYRADLFQQWGIEPPATWDAYERAARRIRGADPSARIGTFPPANSQWFVALAWQAGARWFGADGRWSVDIDDGPTLRVAEYWDRLRRDGLIFTMPDVHTEWYKAVRDGKIVAWLGPQWGDALLKGNAPNTAGKWRVAPMPQWSTTGKASANWGGSSTAVLRGTRHPREALRFALWLNTDRRSVDHLIEGGYGWPAATGIARGSALDRADPFFGGQRYNDVFAEADRHVDTGWRWVPTTAAMLDSLNIGFTEAVGGQGSFVEAVRAAQRSTVRDMRRKGLTVDD